MRGGGFYGGGSMPGGMNMRDVNAPKGKWKDMDFTRAFFLFRPYARLLGCILLLALLSALLGLVPPLIVKQIVDQAIPDHDKAALYRLAALMVLLPVAAGLLGVWQNHLNNKVGQSVMRDLRHKLFANLQRQSMSFYTHVKSGEIIQRLTGDVQAVQGIVTGTVVNALTQIAVVVTTAVILFRLDWKLACLSLVVLPMFILPVRKVSATRKRLRAETQRTKGDMSALLGDMFGVSGALLTRLFGREDYQEKRFGGFNEKVMELELRLNLVGRWYSMAVGVLAPLGTALIFLYGGLSVMQDGLTVGGIIAFVFYAGRLYGPVSTLLNLHVEAATAMGIFGRLFEYMDMMPEIKDAPHAEVLGTAKGKVEYRNVSFRYSKDQEDSYALKGVSFQVEPGELVAVVGHSGAGKTTLTGMLARLHDPVEGVVAVDGKDLRTVSQHSLREQMAFVTQDSFLFHATIRENLLFARSDATEAELVEACRHAYIHNYISGLPDGYDTMVGERGHRLSGGERQRLSIARAILKNPKILVLDEATSHLDSESEAYVQAALEQLMKGRTTVVIAHRLSTILAADRILVMEEGRLAEEGTHQELLRKNGLYARLFRTQFARESKENDGAAGQEAPVE
jgi:ATP-binding cassette, subfamily B, bacterial